MKQLQQTTQYKQTELGPLPKEWEVVRLGDYIVEKKDKNNELKIFTVNAISNVYGFIKSDDFFEKKVYSKNLKDYKIVKRNFFGYNPARVNVGSIALYEKDDDCLVSPMYVVFKVSKPKELFEQYLYRLLKSSIYLNKIKNASLSRGSVRSILSFNDLSDFRIPLPPLSEQKAIASVLSAIQEAKEKTEAAIAATKEFKKSMMKHLFTYGPVSPNEKDKVQLKQTEIGLIPNEWEVVNFEYCILKNNIRVGKVKQLEYKKSGKYPIIDQGQNLIAGFWDNEVDVYMGNLPVIIFGDHTRIIKFIDFPFVLGADGAKVLVPNIQILYPKFFYYVLLTLNIPSRGYNRHYSLLRHFKIPLPPLPVQQKIASILSVIDAKIEAEENKKKALEALFKSMLHNLMTGKVRVNHIKLEESYG